MSLERINVANTNSLFDDFSHLVFNAGEDGDSRQIEVVKNGEKVTGLRFHIAKNNKTASLPNVADLRDTLRSAVKDVLGRSRTRLAYQAWEKGDADADSSVEKKMDELEKLVVDKLFGSDKGLLQVKDVKKIVVDIEALAGRLCKKSVDDILNLDQEKLGELVNGFTKEETEAALGRLEKSAAKAVPYLEKESHYTAEFNEKYAVASADAPGKLETLKWERFHEAMKDEDYCKAQLERDHGLITCSEHRVDEINRFANAADKLPKDKILGFKGDTTAIFNKLVELAKAKGIKDPKILLRLFSDQRLFCGIMRSVSTTQEETVVRGIHPDVFAYMKALGLCALGKDGNYYYTTKENGAPKMDATEGTIVKGKVDFAGKELVDNPSSAYLLFAAELSFATNPTNFDLGGALMHWLKCHENDQDMQSASEKVRDTRILNVGKLITRFFERQEKEWRKTAVAKKSPDNPKAPGYHDGEKNIGGLDFEQYKKAIKILLFSKDKLDIPGDKDLSPAAVDKVIKRVLELAKKDDGELNGAVEKNYIETLHAMYRARIQAANDLGIDYYIGGPAGCGVFDNDPETLRDIEMYEFLMCGGRKMTYVVPVYDRNYKGPACEANDADATKQYINSMERMLVQIKSDKDAYMKMMRAELARDGEKDVDNLSYEELVKRTSMSRTQVQLQKANQSLPKADAAAAAKKPQAPDLQSQRIDRCVANGLSLIDGGLRDLAKEERSLLKDYVTSHSLEFLSDVQLANATGMDVLDMDGDTLTSFVQKVFEDLLSPFRDLMAGSGRSENVDFKPRSEYGPKSANEVELNSVWRQSPGNNTCFMMSVVNGLVQTERGVSLLKKRFGNGGFLVNANPANPTEQSRVLFEVKGDQSMMFERALHYGYKTFLRKKAENAKKKGWNTVKVEAFGEMGNVEDLGRVLGLVPDDAVLIGSAKRDDKFMAIRFAMKVLQALKEGKVCTLYHGIHYRTISDVYLDRDGNPTFRILDSNQGVDMRVYDELVSESMGGDDVQGERGTGGQGMDGIGGAFISILKLPDEAPVVAPKNEAPKNEMPKNEAPVVSPTGGDNRMRNLSSFDSVLSAVDAGNLEDLLPEVNAFINQTLNAKPTYAFFRRYCEVVLELRHLPFRDDQNLGGRIDTLQGNVIRAELKALLGAMRSHEFMESFAANPGDFFRPDFDTLDKKLKEMQNSRAKAEEEARKKAEEAERKKVEEETKAKKLAQAQTNAVHAPNRQLLRLSDIELALRRAIGAAVPEMASHNMQAVMNARRFFSFRGLSHLAFDGSLNFGFVTRGREKVWSKAEEIAILNESLKLMEAVQSGYFQRFCGFRPSEHGDQPFAELGFVIHATLDAVKNRNDSTSEHNASEEDGLL